MSIVHIIRRDVASVALVILENVKDVGTDGNCNNDACVIHVVEICGLAFVSVRANHVLSTKSSITSVIAGLQFNTFVQ